MSRQEDLERIWAEVRALLVNPDEHWPSQLGIELARRGDTEGLTELRRIAREQEKLWRTVYHVVSDQFREVMARGKKKEGFQYGEVVDPTTLLGPRSEPALSIRELIRLAHEKPELREFLLPLIRSAREGSDVADE